MAILTTALGAQSNQMTASGVAVGSFPTPVTIDSETLDITGGSGTSADPYSITRGTFGTARAGHANGASITVGLGGGAGGGSISVTDGTTTVSPATSLRAAAISAGDAGEAIVSSMVVSATDPGAIGAGNMWVRLDPTQSWAPVLQVRNATDDGWVDLAGAGELLGLTFYDEGTGAVRSTITGQLDSLALYSIAADGSSIVNWMGVSNTAITLQAVYPSGPTIVIDATGVHLGAGGPALLTGGVDPFAGAGVAAVLGSVYIKTDGTVFWKTAAPDTGWTGLPLNALTTFHAQAGIDLEAATSVDIIAHAGDLTLAHTGNLIDGNLPTSDPAVLGAWWANAGVVTVSAG